MFGAQAEAAVVDMEEIRYSAYVLDVAGDPAPEFFSRGTAVNAGGQVVGYYRITRDAANTTARGLSARADVAGAYGSASRITPDSGTNRVFPWDVNDKGVLVGGARLSTQRDFIYAFYGAPTSPIDSIASLYGETKGINNLGAAVGYVCPEARDCLNVAGAGAPSAFYYHPDDQKDPVRGFPDLKATASQARAINDKGIIAGAYKTDVEYRALRYDWNARAAEDLHPYFAEAVSSEAWAINRRGDVAGRVGIASPGGGSGAGDTVQQAFVLEQGSRTPTVLQVPAGYEGGAAAAIGDNGWVVGTACASGKDCGRFEDTGANVKPDDNTAVLWVNGLALDLSLLPGLKDSGWAKLSFAESIADLGAFSVIAGVGFYQVGSELQRRAFVLRIDESSVPIPEPRTHAMLAAGLVVLGFVRVRRVQRSGQGQ
jgi:hypothetical protein